MVDKAYFASPEGLTYHIEIAKLVSYLGMGAFFYDIILNLGFDWSLISGKRQRRWPQLAYFSARLSLLVYIALLLQVLWAKTEFACQTVFWLVEFFMGIIVWTSSILLACRTVCVYSGPLRDAVATVVVIMALGLLAAWMQDVKAVTAAWAPPYGQPWNTGACVWLAVSDTYWVKYVCTIVFDFTVMVATVTGILRMNGKSRLGSVLISQGILYFVCTFAANLAITILTLLELSPTLSLMISVPQSVICVICASRLYVDLANEARPRNQSSHYGSSNGKTDTFGQSSQGSSAKYGSSNVYGSKPAASHSTSSWANLYTLKSNKPTKSQSDSKGTVPSYFSNHDDMSVDLSPRRQPSVPNYFSNPFPQSGDDDVEKTAGHTASSSNHSDETAPRMGLPILPGRRSSSARNDSTHLRGVHIHQEQTVSYDGESDPASARAPHMTSGSHPYAITAEKSEEMAKRFPRLLGRNGSSHASGQAY